MKRAEFDLKLNTSATPSVFSKSEREMSSEEFVYKNDDWYKVVIHNSLDAFFVLDENGNILDINDTFCNILGYNREQLLSMSIFNFDLKLKKHPDLWEEVKIKLMRDTKLSSEGKVICKNGKVVIFETNTRFIVYDNRKLFFCFGRDITERKKLECEIKKYQKNLEKLVKERTIELVKINNDLKKEITERIQAQQKIEEQDAQRTNFLHILVHELKTPLTPLISMSEYLLTNHIDEESLEQHLQVIRRGVNKLDKRIDELMDLSRGEMGLLEIEHNNINFVSLLADISKYMELDIQKKRQSFISNIPESLPVIKGDEERIWQVLNNLLNNASKFTPKGGIIELSATDNKNEIVVSIKNTGTSLTDEQRRDIFQPYRSFHTQRDGLGLGLVLSRMLVELHGGRIWAEDYNGKGNIFSFAIPVDFNLNQRTRL